MRPTFRAFPFLTSPLLAMLLAACSGRSTEMPNDDPRRGAAVGENGEEEMMMTSTGGDVTPSAMGSTGSGTGSSSGIGMAVPAAAVVSESMMMNEDGSTTTVVTQEDGTTITTVTTPDGSTTSTIVGPDGAIVGTAGSGGAAAVGGVAISRPPIGGMVALPPGGGTPGEPLVECTPEYQGQGPQSCEISLACANGYAWSSCWNDGGGGWRCDCSGNAGWASIMIGDLDVEDPCAYSVDVCAAGIDVSTAGEPECTPRYQEEGDRYCNVEAECSAALENADGVPVSIVHYESVWCENLGTEWSCGCSDNTTSYNISLQHEGTGVCSTVRDICSAGPIQTAGAYECERTYQSASAGWCDASLECGQSAEVGGIPIQVNGYANVNCQPGAEGEWQCFCQGLGVTSEFQVTASDAWDTCEEASNRCADAISGGE